MEPVETPHTEEVTPPAVGVVRALVQERERFDSWLEALEAKREQTPERVLDRVRADYRARRDAVLAQLVMHVEPLTRWAASLTARQAALATARAGHDEERAEAALRHAVGEFTDAQWEEVRSRVDGALADLDNEDAIIRAEHDDVVQLLASARMGMADVTPVLVDTSVTAEATGAAAERPIAVDAAVDDAPRAGADDAGPEPHPEVEVSVTTPTPVSIHDLFGVGSTDGSEGGAAPVTESPPPASADDELEAAWRESAARGFGTDEARPRVTQEVAALETFEVFTGPQGAVRPATPPTAQEAADPAPSTTSSSGTFDDLAFLRSLTTGPEQTKTLRCTECGTMNFPTEWYCERCGGELAAL